MSLTFVFVSSDPSVDVSAIGIGDMFDQLEENENLKSIACQRDGRVTGMRRFADLVAEEFIDKIETVLCPGTHTYTHTHTGKQFGCVLVFLTLSSSRPWLQILSSCVQTCRVNQVRR